MVSQPKKAPRMTIPDNQSSAGWDTKDNSEQIKDYKAKYRQVSSIEIRLELLNAIAGLDDHDPDFFLMALQDKEPLVRQEAAIQLGNMMGHPRVRQAMIKALDDADDDVLLEVIEAMATIEDPVVQQKLKKIAQTHKDGLIRKVAADYCQCP